jgi:hypothetical protein
MLQEGNDSLLLSSGAMEKARARRLAKRRREKIAAAQRRATEGPLPDFVVLGTQKGGTSFFYRLLTEHPLVSGAAAKELHFFDNKFAEGVGWYRRCFSEGERVDGQRTITGEASPSYLFDQQVPQRMVRIVPEAKLIALLRNPVDRAYSHYQMEVRRGKETRSFEEATQEEMTSAEGQGNIVDVSHAYLRRGLYAEQLERFSFFANRDQLLVVKSENLFTRRLEVLERVLRFLRLPPFDSTLPPPGGKGNLQAYGPGHEATPRGVLRSPQRASLRPSEHGLRLVTQHLWFGLRGELVRTPSTRSSVGMASPRSYGPGTPQTDSSLRRVL